MFNILSLWEVQIKTTMRYTPIRMSKILKMTTPSVDKDGEQLQSSYATEENVKWPNGLKKFGSCLQS